MITPCKSHINDSPSHAFTKGSFSPLLSSAADFKPLVDVPNDFLDDIERAENSNQMIENTVETLLNRAKNGEIGKLLDSGIVMVIEKFFKLVIESSRQTDEINEEEDGIDLMQVMPTGTLDLLKSCSEIILIISSEPEN